MAKKALKIRTSLTLDVDVLNRLRRVSQVSGMSVSAFVNQVVSDSLPHLEAMTQAMALASTDPQRAMRLLSEVIDSSVLEIEEKSKEIKGKVKPRGVKKAG